MTYSFHSHRANCKPRKNIVFVKTHKTGSSTVTNILHRHGDQHDLTFALPRAGQNRLDWPWTMRNGSFELVPGTQPNIVCYHGRYNRAFLDKLMPRDTVYVTILRHPISQYESTFNYLGFEQLFGIENKTNSMEYFLEKPKDVLVDYLLNEDLRVNSDRLKLVRNGMSFDLGLNSTRFDDESEIGKFLRTLRNEFDLVMISEFFDESMVLLKDLLCWPLEDFAYFNLNVRYDNRTGKADVSDKVVDAMRSWNNVDFDLYREFLGIFVKEIARRSRIDSGVRFGREIEELRSLNDKLRKRCLRNVTKTTTIGYGVQLKRLELNGNLAPEVREMCNTMRQNEVDYLRFLRAKQSRYFVSKFVGRLRNALVSFFKFLLAFTNQT